jgi:hypothetical protein
LRRPRGAGLAEPAAHTECSPAAIFLAACLWRPKGYSQSIPLPFWSAPELHHNRLGRHTGLQWMADFLDCVVAAARTGLDHLERLQRAEGKARMLGGTARSHLKAAAEAVRRTPVITVAELAETLGVTTQAARGLIAQLVEAEILREAMGRIS